MISDWTLALLKDIAKAKQPPTRTARWLFLFTQLVHDGFQYVTGNNRNLDMFPKSYDSYTVYDIDNWMNMVCELAYKLVDAKFGATPSTPVSYKPLFTNTKAWTSWSIRAQNYLTARDSDGSLQSSTISGTIPNQGIYIDTSSSGLPVLENANSWTALKVQEKNANYLTPEWGSVKGVIDQSEFDTLYNGALRYYPSPSSFNLEVEQVLDISKSLTDEQKMIAEFWAGIPGGLTPPGFWFIFAHCICKSNNMSTKNEVCMYTLLGLGVFQASILAWKLKRDKLQPRPIQSIRNLFPLTESNWLPYQESDVVTPPFPDFISGHSIFSATSSRILYQFMKKNSIDLQGVLINSELLKLLNPRIFANLDNKETNLCQINILPNSSNIVSVDPVPLSGCRINWSTLDDMAEQAGMSRIYGGIHIMSSNQAGLSTGRDLGALLYNKYSNIFNIVEGPVSGFRLY
jgi:hypothetical protein